MKTSKLDTDVQNFINALCSEANKTKQSVMCADIRKTMEKEHTLGTVRKYLTSFRKAIKEHFGERSPLLKNLRLSKRNNEKIERPQKREIKLRTQKAQYTKINDFEGLIEFAKGLLESSSYLKVSLGLMLLTGRRTIEILKTATFQPVKNKAFKVLFSGQAKLKSRELGSYEIPTLCTAKEAIKALSFIREKRGEFAQLTSEQVNKKCAKSLNDTAKIFSKFLGENVECHDLRKAYAAIIYGKSKTKEDFTYFAANILGHSKDSEFTTETYMKFTI